MIACAGKANLLPMLGWFMESKTEDGVHLVRTVVVMDLQEQT